MSTKTLTMVCDMSRFEKSIKQIVLDACKSEQGKIIPPPDLDTIKERICSDLRYLSYSAIALKTTAILKFMDDRRMAHLISIDTKENGYRIHSPFFGYLQFLDETYEKIKEIGEKYNENL